MAKKAEPKVFHSEQEARDYARRYHRKVRMVPGGACASPVWEVYRN